MSGIFLSYEHQSTAIARQLADDMATLGHDVWFDQALSGGQAWWEHILARIRACDVLVFLLTPAALDSIACTRECDYATALHKPVLPLLVADGIALNLLRPALSRLQYVDCRELDRASGLHLARAFGALPSPEPLPDHQSTLLFISEGAWTPDLLRQTAKIRHREVGGLG